MNLQPDPLGLQEGFEVTCASCKNRVLVAETVRDMDAPHGISCLYCPSCAKVLTPEQATLNWKLKPENTPECPVGFTEVTKDEFYKEIRDRGLNVSTTPEGPYPYTSVFQWPDRREFGRVVAYYPTEHPWPIAKKYFVKGSR